MDLLSLGFVIAVLLAAGYWVLENYRQAQLYTELKPRIENLEKREAQFKNEKEALEKIAKEKSLGFPWLAEGYADYFHLQDLKKASYLESKIHPAKKAAEHVREMAAKRRQAEKIARVAQYQVAYYEALFPWLEEFKGEDLDDLICQSILENEETDTESEIAEDPVKRWLTQAEYAKSGSAERNQLALDRYWQKEKSRWELGRDYERYVGYLYETHGWQVSYQGIVEGFNDLGRDLIVIRGDEIQVIQCKYWSQFRTIHEKHIFQLFGTKVAYELDHPDKQISGVFVTSTVLSERAKQYAALLNITFREQSPLKRYPCIKCHTSRKDGAKIYHLPFDQQYDRTVLEQEKDECYVETVQEAESLGFRRAYRWRGNTETPE